uniref:Palmitoyltransferase n=1 Tax=Trypanosoma congolense (strain IL3000) TaxID=1068625 RepID=G0UU01_TRYCI|nr:putative huntingtin interacting protein (HIP) [Trypanosoma congolense IL3000]
MRVFKGHMEAQFGDKCLPLVDYLRYGERSETPPREPHTLRLGGRTFHESLKRDFFFPSLATFLLGGADVNSRDKSGATALHLAVALDCDTIASADGGDGALMVNIPNRIAINFLIDNDADINARNAAGETPLMVAASTRNIAAMLILLERGADTTLRDDMGYTVFHHACRFSLSLQLLQSFVSDLPLHAKSQCLMHHVCRQGGCGAGFTIRFLVEQLGIDVNAREDQCARPEHSDIKECYGSDAFAMVEMRHGYAPLHCAILTGDLALVCVLLALGADVNQADDVGLTPLQLAASNANLPNYGMSWLRRVIQSMSLWVSSPTHKRVKAIMVYRLLQAYCKETSLSSRENLLRQAGSESGSVWKMLGVALTFTLTATLPHAAVLLISVLTRDVVFVTCVAGLCLLFVLSAWIKGNQVVGAIPVHPVGVFVGYTVVLIVCCALQLSVSSIQQLPFSLPCMWLLICGVGTAVSLLLVICRDPITVVSTPEQRAGIYKTVLLTKGSLPYEAQKSIDAERMVRKPLRAQYCRYTNNIVLRYDHYCVWLATSIGAGNHRSYISFLVLYSLLLFSMYHVAGTSWHFTPGGPTMDCFVWVYVAFVLPVVFLCSLVALLQQLWYISRGVTVYDVQHPAQCLWCFQLGTRTYSLFDVGFLGNLSNFFLVREDFTKLSYIVPSISPRLRGIIKNYQEAQLSPCDHHCKDHSHGGLAPEVPQQHQPPLASTSDVAVVATPCEKAEGERTETAAAQSSAFGEVDAAALRLFQRMVQLNSADVALTDVQVDIPLASQAAVESKAREMFTFFVESKNGGFLPGV